MQDKTYNEELTSIIDRIRRIAIIPTDFMFFKTTK